MTADARELERLVERVVDSGVSPTGANPPECEQRGDRADRPRGAAVEDLVRERGAVVPAPLVQEAQREPRARVRRLEIVLVRVRDVLAQVALRPLELVHLA